MRKNGWNDKLFMLTFTKFKNRFFQGATLSNWFQIFKWIARESLLHRVLGVHKHAGIGIQINTLQTQGNQMTLIHCCFNVATLKQRWTNVIFYPLYNICGFKILIGYCFKDVIIKERGRKRIQDPVKRLGWIIFLKIKTIRRNFCKNAPY